MSYERPVSRLRQGNRPLFLPALMLLAVATSALAWPGRPGPPARRSLGPRAVFLVNSAEDQRDRNLNDGACVACVERNARGICTREACTLRAAIEQANALGAPAEVHFDTALDTVRWVTNMTAITVQLTLGSEDHSVVLTGRGQAAVEDGGLRFEGAAASGSHLRNLTIQGFPTGIRFFDNGGHLIEKSIIQDNGDGILFRNSSGNRIGGDSPTTDADMRIINNTKSGVEFEAASNLNVVESSLILGNGAYGVLFLDSYGNRVGGPTNRIGKGAGNVIGGNGLTGVAFRQSLGAAGKPCGGNTVQGNLIGTDELGAEARPNMRGLHVDAACAPGTLIGGTDPQSRNVISGNTGSGILAEGTGLVVQGNYIGTDHTGRVPLGNGINGITLSGTDHQVGGPEPEAGNLIAGNTEDGIELGFESARMRVQGNHIGIGREGVPGDMLGNGRHGIEARTQDSEFLGNWISGNKEHGIYVWGSEFLGYAFGNRIAANCIGLAGDCFDTSSVDTAVTAGNGRNGITITVSTDNVISDNVVAGNGFSGIVVSARSTNTQVLFNRVGRLYPGPADRQRIGNQQHGIVLAASAQGLVEGNIVVANGGNGIHVTGPDEIGHEIVGNAIGLDAVSNLHGNVAGNGGHGIYISGASGTRIGAAEPPANRGEKRNAIAHNGKDGVHVLAGTRNAILRNLIFSNAGLGINLDEDGSGGTADAVTLNDEDDGDAGANTLQNFPVLTAVEQGPGPDSVTVSGFLESRPRTTYTLYFFQNRQCDASDHGEGRFIMNARDAGGKRAVTTDETGRAAFTFSFVPFVRAVDHMYLTATATDPEGNTSEFSKCFVHAPQRAFLLVNTVVDLPDTSPGDGRCDTGGLPVQGQPECSLRAAIEEANARLAFEVIRFGIPGAGPHTIAPVAALPVLVDAVDLDATSQPGFAGTPVIELDGSGAGSSDGLVARGGSLIHGLAINRFAGHGLVLAGAGNVVVDNHLGTGFAGTEVLGNGGHGVLIEGGDGNSVGSLDPALANVIAHNKGDGIRVASGRRNTLSGNAVFMNGGLGIDLGGDGATANDEGDGDTGANDLQNWPLLISAGGSGSTLALSYRVSSGVESAAYPLAVAFFLASPDDEGQVFLGSDTYSGAGRLRTAAFTPEAALSDGDRIVATATDAEGNTSEFSAAVVVRGGVATSTEPDSEALPPQPYSLEANYPNPFNPATRISYVLSQPSAVRLTVYDVLGRAVAVLVDEQQAAGRHEAVFEAGNLPSGVYCYRLVARSFAAARCMVLVK